MVFLRFFEGFSRLFECLLVLNNKKNNNCLFCFGLLFLMFLMLLSVFE